MSIPSGKIYKQTAEGLVKFPSELLKISSSVTTVDLSVNAFTELPTMEKFKILMNLILNTNAIQTLPVSFARLTSLRKISFTANKFVEIPQQVFSLIHLTYLNFSQNQITEIPHHISSLTQLKAIYLSVNRIHKVPIEMSVLTSVTGIEIDNNFLDHFPEAFCHLKMLVNLNVSCNKIPSFPKEITNLSNLKTLLGQYLGLTELPNYFSALSSLNSIDFENNALTSLNFSSNSLKMLTLNNLTINTLSFANFPKLIHLTIKGGTVSEVTDLPKLNVLLLENVKLNTIKAIPSIGDISLSNNNLKTLPPLNTTIRSLVLRNNKLSSIQMCSNYTLTKIDLSGNAMIAVPLLPITLRVLCIASNKIIEIPNFVSMLTNLREIDFSYNHITSIPENVISSLTNLERLVCHYNYITILPLSLLILPKLKLLGLNHNRLSQFPPRLPPQLTELMVASNSIRVIPDYLSMVSLLNIDLSNNQIIMFDALIKCTTLKDINLSCNPLLKIPYEFFEESTSLYNLQRINLSGNPLMDPFVCKRPKASISATINREKGIITTPEFGRLQPFEDVTCELFEETNIVNDFGIADCKGYREEMQDFMGVIDNYIKKGNRLYVVCDGHSGSVSARLVAAKLGGFLENSLTKQFETIEGGLTQAFRDMNEELIKMGVKDGTTCLCVLATELNVYTANAGDCRCLLVGDDCVEQLTTDHRPSNPLEYKRIRECGGYVIGSRTNGNLAISRSLGDSTHQSANTFIPEVKMYTKTPNDMFLVLACDGVWDVLSNECVADLVRKYADYRASVIANIIKDVSLSLGSTDNISCIVCKFK
ncbi:PH domain leucine-rich repeat protein phosphatase, putative [Entamoeba invadens IP1]|uniref:PH domain leucine-rich repeat protein phosphatase, putative n=1 Tax=Entamoeba invadens IP1 TaxID=370355 RepID=A0A0A1TZE2_ENTIV|nr:PH domain leucine-rich repeat protein phosphatase, putative [Entamoeba invadens IP1]ELP86952.1 PH domain leucine-rich repeat protein phosphatase, putative [Entamoeba invadens IP1]|eukprot:XP_004253723.1 PH domain leucine-rich repeat protein phosphatase, putative [Entamoeba invadens IP1]